MSRRGSQIGGDGRIVLGGTPERLEGEPSARLVGEAAPARPELLEHGGVLGGIGDHPDAAVILGRARIMLGPPMSMFSMTSSKPTPGLATVCSKG